MITFFCVHRIDEHDIALMRQFAQDCGLSELALFSLFSVPTKEGIRMVTQAELSVCRPKLVVATSIMALLSFSQMDIAAKRIIILDLQQALNFDELSNSIIIRLLNQLNIPYLATAKSKSLAVLSYLDWKTNPLYLPVPNFLKSDPIMDRRGRHRILLEVSFQIEYSELCEVYSYVEGKNVEVWLFYEGEVPSWVKPDLLMAELPKSEIGMYYSSCDYAVFVGPITDIAEKFFVCLSNDCLPIVFGEISLNEIRDYGLNLLEFDIDILSRLPLDASVLEELRRQSLDSQMRANQLRQSSILALNLTLENENTDIIDLSFFRNGPMKETVRRNRAVLSLINSVVSSKSATLCKSVSATLISIEGWGISTQNLGILHPIVIFNGKVIETKMERRFRQDVSQMFSIESDTEYGFDILLVFYGDDEVLSNDVIVHLLDDNEKFITLNENLIMSKELLSAELIIDNMTNSTRKVLSRAEPNQLYGGIGAVSKTWGNLFSTEFAVVPNRIRFIVNISWSNKRGYLFWRTSREMGLTLLPEQFGCEKAVDLDLPSFLHSAKAVEIGIWIPNFEGEAWFAEVPEPA